MILGASLASQASNGASGSTRLPRNLHRLSASWRCLRRSPAVEHVEAESEDRAGSRRGGSLEPAARAHRRASAPTFGAVGRRHGLGCDGLRGAARGSGRLPLPLTSPVASSLPGARSACGTRGARRSAHGLVVDRLGFELSSLDIELDVTHEAVQSPVAHGVLVLVAQVVADDALDLDRRGRGCRRGRRRGRATSRRSSRRPSGCRGRLSLVSPTSAATVRGTARGRMP